MYSNNHKETPEVSIDQALELFIAITYPQGIPENIDKEELFRTLKAKIAKDRPEWAAKNAETENKQETPPPQGNYNEIKAAIISKSNQPDVPEDSEERYLYERKQKALVNLEAKKTEEAENAYSEELRKQIIEKNKGGEVDEDFLRKTVKIKLELQKKLGLLQSPVGFQDDKKNTSKPQFSSTENKAGKISFTESRKETQTSLDAEFSNELPLEDGMEIKTGGLDFIKSIEKLDRNDRIDAMREFNKSRRALMQTKEAVLMPRSLSDKKVGEDDRFSMGIEEKKEVKKPDQEQSFLDYLIERRSKKSSGLDNTMGDGKKPFGVAVNEDNDSSLSMNSRSFGTGSNRPGAVATDDMSLERTNRSAGLTMDNPNKLKKLTLE